MKRLLLAIVFGFACHSHSGAETALDLFKPVAGNIRLASDTLVNWDGEPANIANAIDANDISVVNFVFSGCAAYCPLSLSTMQYLDSKLSEDGRAGLITITIDPFNDQPAVFAAFASKFSPSANWSWLTGDSQAVFATLDGLNYRFGDINAHAPVFLIFDRVNGRYLEISSDVEADRMLAIVQAAIKAR